MDFNLNIMDSLLPVLGRIQGLKHELAICYRLFKLIPLDFIFRLQHIPLDECVSTAEVGNELCKKQLATLFIEVIITRHVSDQISVFKLFLNAQQIFLHFQLFKPIHKRWCAETLRYSSCISDHNAKPDTR